MTLSRLFDGTLSFGLSGAALLFVAGLFTDQGIELDGGGDPAPARLGHSFADMVAGMPGTEQPETIDPVHLEEIVEPAEVPDTAAQVTDPEAELPVEPNQSEPVEADPTDAAAPEAPVEPVMTSRAVEADAEPEIPEAPAPVATESVIAAVAAAPVQAVQPAAPAAASPVAPAPEIAEAHEEDLLTPLSSPRPTRRPADLAPPPPPPQTAAPRPQPQQPAAQPPAGGGNAATNAVRGNAQGTETGAATATAPAPQAAPQPGNGAAVANYPGQVMRQISRQGRPRMRHSGPDAVVAFRINGGGGLAGISLARSSGSAQLDQAALALVRGAAPFPAPPAGAQTSFSVAFGGR